MVIREIDWLTEGHGWGEIGDDMKIVGHIVCATVAIKWFEWLTEGDGRSK